MPVDIHGKEYYTVVERMGKLIDEHKKQYSLITKLLSCDDKKVVVQATLSFDGNEYTGLAMELVGGNFINEFSALENCETSAIGRALSSAGYFGSEFCSANELENAVNQQQNKPKKEEPKPIPEDINPLDIPQDRIELGGSVSGVEIQDDIKLTFGKNKGKMLSECDAGYLEWLQSPKAEKSLSFFDDKSKVEKIQWAAAYFLFKLKEDEKIPF